MRNLLPHGKRIFGFAMVPGFSFLAAILILPLVSSRFGAEGWSSVALGQSIGAVLAVFGGLSWPIVGGQLVAQAGPAARVAIYVDSLRSRLIALACILPLGLILCYAISPVLFEFSALFMVGTALNCMTASWYFAGTGEPRYLVRNEAAVRLASYGISLGLLTAGLPLWTYASCLILAGILMPIFTAFTVLGGWPEMSRLFSEAPRAQTPLKDHIFGGLSRTFSQAFYYAGPSLVAGLSPSSIAVFSAADQVQKALNNGLSALPQSMVWWVGSAREGRERTRRVLILDSLAAIASLLGGVVTFWLLPSIVDFLFSGEVSFSLDGRLGLSMVIALAFLSQCLSNLSVVPLGRGGSVYPVLISSTLVATCAFFPLTINFGADGAIWSLAVYSATQVLAFGGISAYSVRGRRS